MSNVIEVTETLEFLDSDGTLVTQFIDFKQKQLYIKTTYILFQALVSFYLKMLARVLFYPSLMYTYCMTKFTLRKWYDRIDYTVILGAVPLKVITHQLIAEENIKGVVSLNEDFELKYLTYSTEEYNAMGLEHLKLSTVDFTGTPTLEKLNLGVQFLNRHRALGQSVYAIVRLAEP